MTSLLAALSLTAVALPLGSATAAVYDFQDNTQYPYTNPTRTKLPSSTWTLGPTAANSSIAPLAWIEQDASLNKWGAIGTLYGTIAVGPITVGASLPATNVSGSRVTVDLMLRDALDPQFTGRDAYGFSILATDLTVLFSASFTPVNASGAPATTATWTASALGLDSPISLTMTELETYRFFVDFTNAGYTLGVADANGLVVQGATGTTAGYNTSKQIGSIVFSTSEVTPEWGSGSMLFDDIDVGATPIPEASVVSVFGVLGVAGLLRRRRAC